MSQPKLDCGECLLAFPSSDTDFDKLNFQLLGFCAWSFVVGKGALVPGNPNIGVVEWREKCFAFSSADAAREFGKNPDKFFYDIMDIIRERPEYVHLFQLYNELQIMNRLERMSGECMPLKMYQEQEVQTETHVLPTNVDKDYASSLWEHRQRALQLATLSLCTTRSTQTYKSHFRNGISIQTISPKDKEVQTRKDISTNTSTFKKTFFHLKGKNNDVQLVECPLNIEEK